MDDQTKREFKDAVYAASARVGKALANGHRLELLDLLAQRERSVEELARETGMSEANTSQHLQKLRSSHLVRVRRDGVKRIYRLGDGAFEAWRTLRQFGVDKVPEVDRLVADYFTDRAGLDEIGPSELATGLRDGRIVLIDVRPIEEYQAGHIPGARSMPIGDLERDLGILPDDLEVIAYCRGPFCVFSDDAVRLLRERGRAARRLAIGFADWQATRAGL